MTIESILPVPDIFNARRVLCIQPHYEDNDIGAGGTLATLHQKGAELFYVTVTDVLMGIGDHSLSTEKAAQALRRDQFAAGKIIGLKDQFWLGYPDAGEYSYFDLRRDILKYIRMIQPDFIVTAHPCLRYEAHRNYIQTGPAAEATMFTGLTKIPTSDPQMDAAYQPHEIQGIAFYFRREPNQIMDISATLETKLAAVRCYRAQFNNEDMEHLIFALELKSQQVATGETFTQRATESAEAACVTLWNLTEYELFL